MLYFLYTAQLIILNFQTSLSFRGSTNNVEAIWTDTWSQNEVRVHARTSREHQTFTGTHSQISYRSPWQLGRFEQNLSRYGRRREYVQPGSHQSQITKTIGIQKGLRHVDSHNLRRDNYRHHINFEVPLFQLSSRSVPRI